MSRYNTIIKNDVTNGEGVCVSFFVQGCPHHCKGCFNEETWSFSLGKEYDSKVKWEVIEAIGANGIERNFSVLGGEPMAPQNLEMVEELVTAVRHAYPKIKIYLWTGYQFEDLISNPANNIQQILDCVDVLIDGVFVESLKDLSLNLRGSSNQHIYIKKNNNWELKE